MNSERSESFDSEKTAPLTAVIAIAASAGGLGALSALLGALPAHFPAVILVVQHLDPHHPSLMPEILQRRTTMRVKQAEDGDQLTYGKVFIAPPNYHLMIKADGSLSLSQTDPVHFVRPSADVLFESVAAIFQQKAIAVVLTGTGSDGAQGVMQVKRAGGTVIAQDQATSEFFGMPDAAIRSGSVDFILPLKEIAPKLQSLVERGEVPES